MSDVFTIFQTKHKASKPTRFKAEKIAERKDKPHFLKVHFSKTKKDLEASGFLTGTLSSAVENILKHIRSGNGVEDNQMYYNMTLMIAGVKKDLEKFLNDNIPTDTFINQDYRQAHFYVGPLANFNYRWLKSDFSAMKTLEEALAEFADLQAVEGDKYNANVQHYFDLYATYFNQAESKHELAKATKETNTLSFEALGNSLGPFKYPETGIAFLKHAKSNMGQIKKKESKKAADNTFDKYFISEPGAAIRVSLTTNSKTGLTSLIPKKELESSISTSTRSKAFKPFPNLFPHLYFNNENIYDPFMRELSNNFGKLANTLSHEYFASSSDIHINANDTEQDKLAKINKFLEFLNTDYNNVRQSKLLAVNRSYVPVANVPVSTGFKL